MAMTTEAPPAQYLRALWPGGEPADQWLPIWRLRERYTFWVGVGDVGGALEVVDRNPDDLYVGMGLHPTALGAKQRGGVASVSGIAGLWAEFDTSPDGRPDQASILELLDGLPFRPSMLVDSGSGGVHAYWLFREPWIFEDARERQMAAAMVQGWESYIHSRTEFKFDKVFDLARVLRIPGTFNTKGGLRRPVRLLRLEDERRFDPWDFESYLPRDEPAPSGGRSSVAQRWTVSAPCPVCSGHPRMPQGGGVRCWGYLDSSGRYARCTREEFAGTLKVNTDHTFSHLLGGSRCDCGLTHGGPASSAPPKSAVYETRRNNEKSSWPEPPGPAAYMGLAGEIRDFSDPHTEADPVAVLTHFLLAFGSAVGFAPHVVIGATRHTPRNFAAIVGRSSKARKGDSAQIAGAIIGGADPVWADRIRGGLSSGEGVIAQVRDEVTKADGTVVDEGVRDKRMFIIEPEFARVLTVMKRQGNTVSAVLRDAWDSGRIATMTKSPMVATGAHISVIAHITVEELRRELDDTSLANGFANRFLWIAARRSKELPMPEPLAGAALTRLCGEISKRINLARLRGAMTLDAAARDLWHDMYADLSRERDGLVGGILTRSEAHVIRLALIYALLDGAKETISPAHILAGAELLAYSERSVEFVFGDSTGDPIADAIIRGLSGGPMTRTEIMNLFSRNESGARIDRALRHLHEGGRARMNTEATAGRPREVWAKA
jgi:hypothetical protein